MVLFAARLLLFQPIKDLKLQLHRYCPESTGSALVVGGWTNHLPADLRLSTIRYQTRLLCSDTYVCLLQTRAAVGV